MAKGSRGGKGGGGGGIKKAAASGNATSSNAPETPIRKSRFSKLSAERRAEIAQKSNMEKAADSRTQKKVFDSTASYDTYHNLPPKSRISTKKAGEVITNYVKKQSGVNIEKYRDATTRSLDERGLIHIDWKGMSHTERQNLLSAIHKKSSPVVIADGGAWMKTLYVKQTGTSARKKTVKRKNR